MFKIGKFPGVIIEEFQGGVLKSKSDLSKNEVEFQGSGVKEKMVWNSRGDGGSEK